VRDQHRRRARRGEDPAQIVEQRLARGRIQRGEGLVEEEHVRRGREGPREAHALGLPARQPVHGPVRQRGDAEAIEPVPGPTVGLRARHAPQATREARVVEDGAPAEERLLEDARHAPPPGEPLRLGRRHRAVEPDGAAGRAGEERQRAKKRGLPGAVRPDHRQHLARLHRERRHGERRCALVLDLEVQGFQDRRGRARHFRRRVSHDAPAGAR
jgi:hypothetical protein